MMNIENIIGKPANNIIKLELELKAKELKIPNRSKLKKEELIDKIVEYTNNPPPPPQPKEKKIKEKKKSIPKTLKNMVWDTYIGKDKGTGKCLCCHKEIDSKHFECGHVISEAKGGSNGIDNMRPVCSLCNKSMGTEDMNIFIQMINIKKPLSKMNQLLQDYGFVKKQPTITYQKIEENQFNVFDIGQNANNSYENILGMRTSGSYNKTSNINSLIDAIDYNNIIVNKLTKLWSNYNSLLKLGAQFSLDKYDINKCILHTPKKDLVNMNITHMDYEYVLVDIYTLNEFINLGEQNISNNIITNNLIEL